MRVSRPAREKRRRRRVLVVSASSPRAMRAVQRARLWAITWTVSQAPFGKLKTGEAPRGEMVEADAVLQHQEGVLDLGVAAMIGLRFQGVSLPVGDEGVIAVAGEPGLTIPAIDTPSRPKSCSNPLLCRFFNQPSLTPTTHGLLETRRLRGMLFSPCVLQAVLPVRLDLAAGESKFIMIWPTRCRRRQPLLAFPGQGVRLNRPVCRRMSRAEDSSRRPSPATAITQHRSRKVARR